MVHWSLSLRVVLAGEGPAETHPASPGPGRDTAQSGALGVGASGHAGLHLCSDLLAPDLQTAEELHRRLRWEGWHILVSRCETEGRTAYFRQPVQCIQGTLAGGWRSSMFSAAETPQFQFCSQDPHGSAPSRSPVILVITHIRRFIN